MLKKTIAAVALIGGLMAPVGAYAASRAIVTNDLNMRTGPSVSYHRFEVIPDGARVTVYDCRGSWCRVHWAGRTGWVSANYLAFSRARAPVRVRPPVVVRPPIIDFRFGFPRHHGRWDRHHNRNHRGHDHHGRDHDWRHHDHR
jgi:uncharacterized protein YraI